MNKLKELTRWIVSLCVIISMVGIFIVDHRRVTQGECVAQWADNYTATVKVRSDANAVRLNTLHKLLLDAVESPTQVETAKDQMALFTALATKSPDDPAIQAAAATYVRDLKANASNPVLLQDVENFVNTERDYQAAIKDHPLPDPPKEVC